MKSNMNYNNRKINDNTINVSINKVITLIILAGVSTILSISIFISVLIRCKEFASIILSDSIGITILISAVIAVIILLISLVLRL